MARKKRRPPVDWSKVPVVITGTPNPEAIRLIVESIREFEYRELLKKQAATLTPNPSPKGRGESSEVVGGGISIPSQTG